MEEQSPEVIKSPDLKSDDLTEAEAADILSDGLLKPGHESYGVEKDIKETEYTEREKVKISVPEEELETSVSDVLPGIGDSEEMTISGEKIFQKEDGDEEPERQVEEDQKECTDLQHKLNVDSENEQELLRELQKEHDKLSQLNYQLQKKLSKSLWIKSDGELQSVQEKTFSNQECCEKYPDIIDDVKRQKQDKKQTHLHHQHVDDLRRQNNEKLEQIQHEWNMLVSAKHKVVITDLEQAMGKMKAQAVAQRLLTAVQKCEDDFVSIMHEAFKLNLMMSKVGLQGGEEDLDGEMGHINLEQLKFENENCREKIQEGREDLNKFKKMLPQKLLILMHVKEKLRFVQAENQVKRVRCDKLDALVPHQQKALLQTMRARDTLRFDILRKRQDCGLLGNPILLQDFEDIEDEREALERQVKMLKRNTQDTH